MGNGRHCSICGASVDLDARFCEKCRTYYCHFVYRVKKEELVL